MHYKQLQEMLDIYEEYLLSEDNLVKKSCEKQLIEITNKEPVQFIETCKTFNRLGLAILIRDLNNINS